MEEVLRRELEEMSYLQKVGAFGKKKALTRFQVLETLQENVQKISFGEDSKNYILKNAYDERGIIGIASANMYEKLGIHTPKIYLPKQKEFGVIRSIQRDVSELDGLEILLADNCFEYKQIERDMFGREKWQLFYDSNLKNRFLSFMTKDCLEQLKNIYLVDELRTDKDRYLKNFFLYRAPGSEKYEGVIVIDLEELAIYFYCNGYLKSDFKSFLHYGYSSSTPQQSIDMMCYADRIKEIQTLIQDGVLSQSNIEVLKKALNYDLPKEVKKVCSTCNIRGKKKNNIVDPIKRLWEYNNKTVGKELE